MGGTFILIQQDNKYRNFLAKAEERLNEIKKLQAAGLICYDGDFVPSVHYPPITQYPLISEDELFAGYTLPQDGLLDVYVHIPFCEQHCTFCHYPVKVGQQTEEKNRYLAALEKEMDLYMNRLGIDKIKARSILIGGGTPTFLTPEQLERFLQFFSERVDMTHCTQFNYDVDPGSLVGDTGIERLRIMREYGVDRLTIGVQSLDDSVLKIMNRPHNAQTAIESIENSRKFGYQLNIEFIFGHPGETIENWIDVIEKAAKLPVDEIQLYRLKVQAYGDRQGDIIKLRERRSSNVVSFEDTMMMKQLAIDILADHGFHENLRRVYSKKKEHFSHYAYNQCCMLYDQIGLGLTAFSSLKDRFGLNTQYFDEYYANIEDGKLPLNRGYIRSKEDQMRWAIVLPLKNSELKKAYFEEMTGISFDNIFRQKVKRLEQFGLIEKNNETVSLTELGAFVADEVVEQFNSNEFMPFSSDAYAQGPLHPYADNISGGAAKSNQSFVKSQNCDILEPWGIRNVSDQQILSLLTATGAVQQELFKQARETRHQYLGDEITLRGVIEISNICQKNCDYCAMRHGNSSLKRFRLDPETIVKVAKNITEFGITTIFLQAGQDVHCDPILEEVIPVLANDLGAEVLLNVGERSKETYNRFAQLGTKSFILKYETSDPAEYEFVAHDDLDKRIQCMKWIRDAGMKIGTGNIIGLPRQSIESLVSDIQLAFKFKPDFVSTAPFIPNQGTPLQDQPTGDINLILNTMSILRVGLKDPLIPTVSALEYIQPGGQLKGLNAGANVMTVNFTPNLYRDHYKIYAKDRYIVTLNHAIDTAKMAGLEVNLPLS